MPFFLIPIVAGAATYGAATQDEAGQYSAGEGQRTIDAYQIWAQITSGPGTASIDEGQQAASTLKGSYDQRVRTIEDLSRDMDAAWQGSAGEAVNSGAHPLKVWMEDSRDKLQDSDKYLGEQRSAFTTVHSKVEQVPPKPPESGFLNDVTPWETDTDRAINDYNTKAQANVDAFNAYFQASNDNASGMPTYSEMDGEFGKIEAGDGGTDGPGGPGDRNGGGGGGGGYSPGQIPGGGGGGYQPGNIPGGGGGYTPGQIPGGGGGGGYGIPGGGGYDIPGVGGNRPGANVPGAGGYTPGQIPEWDDSTSASGYKPGSIPAADLSRGGGGGGGFTPGSAGSIGGGGGGGFGPGGGGSGGGFGPGSAGGFGPGSGTGSVAPGASSGAGAGGQGGVGRGGAMGGAAGGRGMGGMMGGGARGGQGGGDEEHQNKFLVEEDPNSLFGSDELTAPPVIGE